MRRPFLSIAVVIVAGAGISGFLLHREHEDMRRDQEQLLAHIAGRVSVDLRSRVSRVEQAIQGLRGLYAAERKIDPAAWDSYLEHLEAKPVAGVSGFTYVRRVRRENEPAFIEEMRAIHGPGFALAAAARPGDERAIIVLRRFNTAEPSLLGFDMSVRPGWAGLGNLTRRTGVAVLTAPVSAINPPHGQVVALIAPLYEPGRSLVTEEDRVAAQRGWVYAYIEPENFFRALDPDIGAELAFEISDVGGSAESLVYREAGKKPLPADALRHVETFTLLNRTWRITLSAPENFRSFDRSMLAIQLFAGGLLMTTLLSTLVWNLGRTQYKAICLAEQMTRDLQEREWMLGEAQRIANIGVCHRDFRTQTLSRSDEYLRLFGLPPGASPPTGQVDFLSMVHVDDRVRMTKLFTDFQQGKASGPATFRINSRDRGERTLFAAQGLLQEEGGRPQLAIGIIQDVTERVAAASALAESHTKLERLMRVLPGAVFQLRRGASGELSMLFMSEGAGHLFGLPADVLVADVEKLFGLFAAGEAETTRQSLAKSAEKLEPWEAEVMFTRVDAGLRWARFHAIAERTKDDAVVWHGVAMDATAAKEAELRLRFTQFAVDHVRDAVAFITPTADRVYVNDETCRMTGYTREELLSQKIWATFTAFTMERYCHLWNLVKRQGTHIFEALLMTKSGESRPVEVGVSFIKFGEQEIVFAIARDISARKAAEQALRASEESLRFTQYALDHAQDVVSILDREGNRLHVNETYCRYTGYSRAELLAGKVWELVPSLNQDRFREMWDDIKRCGTLSFEIDVVARGGDRRPLETIASFLTFDGREVVCTVSRDLTARKAAELEKKHMEQQLRETQKLESLGVLAGGIAHDFNNLLTGILGNASLARDRLAAGDAQHEPLRQIERASARAAELCQQMLAYAGKGRFIVEAVDLSVLVEDTAKLLELSVARRAVLDMRLESALPSVLADATQMRQIVMNLVLNAAEAISHANGRIVVTTGRMQVDRGFLTAARVAAGLAEGEAVYLEVVDNGSGMDRTTLERIFDPFFTTKFTGRGLGLAAVLGIVRSHKGALDVRSEPGRGTTFRLVLAPHAGAARESASPFGEVVQPVRRNTGNILVIDDEESVRSVTKQALERTGYTVDMAEDGEAGLSRLREAPGKYLLILLDYTMPRLDGAQTLREIRRINPQARVVMMSGFSEVEARERIGDELLSGFIQKPFDLPTLRRQVETVIKVAGGGIS